MILEFKVKNFLSIKEEQTLSFEATSDNTLEDYFIIEKAKKRLLKMALIFGANASGKTNLLKALDFLRWFVINNTLGKTDSTNFLPFLLEEETKKSNGEFQLSFFIGDVLYEYQLELNHLFIEKEKLTYYPGIKPALVFSRTYDRVKDLAIVNFGSSFKLKATDKALIQGSTIPNMSVIAAFSKLNIDFPVLRHTLNYFSNSFSDIVMPHTDLINWTSMKVQESDETKKFVLGFLNNADFNILDIKVEEKEKPIDNNSVINVLRSSLSSTQKQALLAKDKLMHRTLSFSHKAENDKHIDFTTEMESAGTNRLFGLSGALYHILQNNKLLMVDEIDSSLHPDLVIHFINTFLVNSGESQLICTTHDLNILSEQDNLRKDIVWFTEKDEDGATELFSMADFKQRKELSFINAYKAGKFGAKPKLGTIYLQNLTHE